MDDQLNYQACAFNSFLERKGLGSRASLEIKRGMSHIVYAFLKGPKYLYSTR